MKIRKKGYKALLVLTILFTVCAISTVLPSERVNEISMLGYKAHCSFTPVSTILCIGLAGLTCFIRKRFFVSYK
ncbi:MAG: hypothetical protein GQ564_05535 [Bacteroidales bacterium]|nr:hypothetical protein [Bacteroidales bacterium]